MISWFGVSNLASFGMFGCLVRISINFFLVATASSLISPCGTLDTYDLLSLAILLTCVWIVDLSTTATPLLGTGSLMARIWDTSLIFLHAFKY